MPEIMLERLSRKKFAIFSGFLLLCFLSYILIGVFVSPAPSFYMSVLGTKCIAEKNHSRELWYWPRGKNKCESVRDFSVNSSVNDVIFAFQIPLPKNGVVLDYSRWQQTLSATIFLDLHFDGIPAEPNATLAIDARLGYRNKEDPDDFWREYASSIEKKLFRCNLSVDMTVTDLTILSCVDLPLFALGSLYNDFYLLNIRAPQNSILKPEDNALKHVENMWVLFTHQNRNFTTAMVMSKVFFFFTVLLVMFGFWRRICQRSQSPVLREYLLMLLGLAVSVLNCPLEFLTLVVDCPWITVVNDIRLWQFYASLLSFWLVFSEEHIMGNIGENDFKVYWRHVNAVIGLCFGFFAFDAYRHGLEVINPFYTFWGTETGLAFAFPYIILCGISSGLYFCFLSYVILKVVKNISSKNHFLPQEILFRYKVIMLVTLICAAITIIGFILERVSEGPWTFSRKPKYGYTSGFFTGMYAMWNIYTLALLSLHLTHQTSDLW